jgi:hypothetical protein
MNSFQARILTRVTWALEWTLKHLDTWRTREEAEDSSREAAAPHSPRLGTPPGPPASGEGEPAGAVVLPPQPGGEDLGLAGEEEETPPEVAPGAASQDYFREITR